MPLRDNAKHNAQRRWKYATDPEHRERRIARSVEYRRRAAKADPAKYAAAYLRRAHGLSMVAWTAIWDAQDGRCYLCGRELDQAASNTSPTRAVVDHLHDHCGPKKSCPACQRGLACDRCNRIIGTVDDDPDLLLRIAAALAAANTAARARIAVAPAQDQLLFD